MVENRCNVFLAGYGIDASILATEWEHLWGLDRLVVNHKTII